MCLRELNPVLWESLEGGGREVQEGGDIRTPVADSCGCMAETNAIF